MNLIQETKFFKLYFDENTSIGKIDYTPATATMTHSEFKAMVMKEKTLLEIWKPKRYLANMITMQFVIVPELQDWLVKEFIPVFAKLNVERIAMSVSPDIFIEVAVEQTIDESGPDLPFENRRFPSEAEAMNWLLED